MRTPTACSASTSPKAPTCPPTAPNTSAKWPPASTAGHAKRSAGKPQPSVSLTSWQQPVDHRCCDDPLNPPFTGGLRACVLLDRVLVRRGLALGRGGGRRDRVTELRDVHS